jgi:hypothetical protein
MTKYILIGGYPSKAKDGGKAICKETAKDFSGKIKILICLFARPENLWVSLYGENKQFFLNNLNNQEIIFELANPNNFIKQLKNINVVYFSGGDSQLLSDALDKNPGWVNSLDGRTIIGSSASTDMLSTYNFDLKYFKCSSGTGLVPVKTLVHYESKDYTPPNGWDDALAQLKKYKKDLPIWTLKEGEYKVFKK